MIRSTLVVPIIRDDLISIQLKVFELKKIQELIIKIPKNAFSLTYFSTVLATDARLTIGNLMQFQGKK